jgi:hypothetical protein
MILDIVPPPDPEDLPKVPFLLTGVPTRFVKEHQVIPLGLNGHILSVLTDNVSDLSVLDALQVAASSDILVYRTEDSKLIDDYLRKFYSREPILTFGFRRYRLFTAKAWL